MNPENSKLMETERTGEAEDDFMGFDWGDWYGGELYMRLCLAAVALYSDYSMSK